MDTSDCSAGEMKREQFLKFCFLYFVLNEMDVLMNGRKWL